jgi:hypothetical protein
MTAIIGPVQPYLRRKVHGRVEFTNGDRLFFILLYRCFPSVLKAVTIIQPETLVRWHRAGFRRYWRCKSRNPGGRPRTRWVCSLRLMSPTGAAGRAILLPRIDDRLTEADKKLVGELNAA